MSPQFESLTPDQWQQRAAAALARVAQMPHDLSTAKSSNNNRISLQKLVWSQADVILALKAKGVSYRTIAEQLTDSGIPVTQAALKTYICRYRKQKGQSPAEQEKKLSREERIKKLMG